LQGSVKFKNGAREFQPLDFNGYPAGAASRGPELQLAPHTIYYLVTQVP
jgi:hypothetical protein